MISNELYADEKYFSEAIHFTKSHYENFPVISFFVQKPLRKYVAVIYQFARQADDLADEGNLSSEERILKLEEYELQLNNALHNKFSSGFWKILKSTVVDNSLSELNFKKLLTAFKQDVVKKRYSSFEEILGYCKNSADPVGRLILELHQIKDDKSKFYSDKICTALQLANFYQDVSIDNKKNRIYIPKDELDEYNVTENEVLNGQFSEKFKELLKYQVDRVEKLFKDGRNLLKYLPIGLKFQILVTIKGGEAILKKIKKNDYNVLKIRPTLSKYDFIKLFLTAILFRR